VRKQKLQYSGHVIRTSALIYTRGKNRQEEKQRSSKKTLAGRHQGLDGEAAGGVYTVQLWPETGISGERRCEYPWSPTMRNEKGIRQGKAMSVRLSVTLCIVPLRVAVQGYKLYQRVPSRPVHISPFRHFAAGCVV